MPLVAPNEVKQGVKPGDNTTHFFGVDSKPCAGLRVAERKRGIAGDIVRQEFQGCEAMKLCVFGLVDDTHPPATDLLDDAVVRDSLTDQGRLASCAIIVGAGIGQVNALREG